MKHTVLKKVIPIALAVILALWIAVVSYDFSAVESGQIPTFCVKTESCLLSEYATWAHYAGLGYSFYVVEAFPVDIDPIRPVYEYEAHIFGINVKSGTL